MIGGVSDLLGMGIIIQLRNMFTIPANQVINSSRGLATAILGDANKINTGLTTMVAGGSMMMFGAGVIAMFTAISKATLEASSNLEIFKNQIRLLAKSETVGDNLFTQLTAFATKVPFTIPQVMAGARNLLAFGFTADRVMKELQLAGEWASMMQMPIDYAAMILGKIRTGGIAQAMRFAQVRGISYADIAAEGGPIDPKTQRTKKGADPELFVEAMNKAIQKKFAGGIGMYMGTLPGMFTNIKDQLILLGASIGDQIKPQMKEITRSILGVFNPELSKPFAKAFGEGLLWIMKITKLLVTPLALLVVWVMKLSKEHPTFVKMGMTLLYLAGVLGILAGAVVVAIGAFRVFSWALGAEKLAATRQILVGMLGPLGWVTAAAILFGNIWVNNFLGIRSVLEPLAVHIKLIALGLTELLTSIASGVGTMSQATADKLGDAGVLGVTITVFQTFYRFYEFLLGFWESVKTGIDVLSVFASILLWLTSPIWGVVYGLVRVLQFLGWVGNLASSSVWKAFGVSVGVIASGIMIASAATRTWAVMTAIATAWQNGYNIALAAFAIRYYAVTIATSAAAAAQWLFNVALTANPIGLIIAGVGALIGGIVMLVKNFHQISAWFGGLPMWAKIIVGTLGFFITIPFLIINYWDKIKTWFKEFGSWISELWTSITSWIYDSIVWLVEKMARLLRYLPGSMGDMFAKIDDDLQHKQQEKELLASHPGMTVDQVRHLSDTHSGTIAALDSQSNRMDRNFNNLHSLLERQANRPIHNDVTIKLDGKTVGRHVSRWQESEFESGRGG